MIIVAFLILISTAIAYFLGHKGGKQTGFDHGLKIGGFIGQIYGCVNAFSQLNNLTSDEKNTLLSFKDKLKDTNKADVERMVLYRQVYHIMKKNKLSETYLPYLSDDKEYEVDSCIRDS